MIVREMSLWAAGLFDMQCELIDVSNAERENLIKIMVILCDDKF